MTITETAKECCKFTAARAGILKKVCFSNSIKKQQWSEAWESGDALEQWLCCSDKVSSAQAAAADFIKRSQSHQQRSHSSAVNRRGLVRRPPVTDVTSQYQIWLICNYYWSHWVDEGAQTRRQSEVRPARLWGVNWFWDFEDQLKDLYLRPGLQWSSFTLLN